jgi:Fe-S-cluster containining protein
MPDQHQDHDHAPHWIRAAADPAIAQELSVLFDRAAHAIAQRGPACWASGRCCNFDAAGHRLYATGLETAYCLLHAGTISTDQLDAARARGGCPYQSLNLCQAHAHKPIGCRIYFCDRSAQAWQHELYESLLADLRAVHDRHHLPYLYAEWRSILALLAPHQQILRSAGASPFHASPHPGHTTLTSSAGKLSP